MSVIVKRLFNVLLWLSLLVAGCAAGEQVTHQPDALATAFVSEPRQPFFDARAHRAEYVGPGREVPPPEKPAEVKIGWFGPTDPRHPEAGGMWCAARLAVDEANRTGGYHGSPFRLVSSWSENPWGTGIKGITRLAYDEDVWAVVGGPDGPSAHLVEQVVAKARLAFVSPVATDKTANLANVPWIFSCAPGDHLLAPMLAEAVVRETRGKSLAMVSCTDHDSRMFTTELLAALRKHGAFPALHLEFRPGDTDFTRQLESLRADHDFVWPPSLSPSLAAAVVLIAGPRDSAHFLDALRTDGLTVPVYGGPAMGHRLFAESAGPAAEGVVFPRLWHPSVAGERSTAFARRFRTRFGIEPDYTAAHTYDAMNLLIAAIRRAGLNRVLIRDALRELSPWPGVTGTIDWDPTGQNQSGGHLGAFRNAHEK